MVLFYKTKNEKKKKKTNQQQPFLPIIDNIVCYFIDLYPTSFVIHRYNCSFCPCWQWVYVLSSSYRALFKHSLFTHLFVLESTTTTTTTPTTWIFIFPKWMKCKKKPTRQVRQQQKWNAENNFCSWMCRKMHHNGNSVCVAQMRITIKKKVVKKIYRRKSE